ncbi:MAG: host-nuclease inhibitor Gam family protein [Candidatus Abawacabacteria bacterium]|nr:host-nuclease inhibitor Gam family protein [Candidatus Abawacabacteria bacterium]
MPRRKSALICSSWEECNAFLYRLAEINVKTSQLEGEMTTKINQIKIDYDSQAKGLKTEKADMEKAIEEFCANCKDEFTKTRKKEMSFGVVAYRITQKVTIRSIEACLTALKSLNLHNCIRIKEEPNKDAMAQLDAQTLAKCGASLKTEDKLKIEPDMAKIKVD